MFGPTSIAYSVDELGRKSMPSGTNGSGAPIFVTGAGAIAVHIKPKQLAGAIHAIANLSVGDIAGLRQREACASSGALRSHIRRIIERPLVTRKLKNKTLPHEPIARASSSRPFQ